MAKVKDWWIYQERKTDEPWALHLVVQKDGRSIRCKGELFAEWVSSDSHKFVFDLVPLSSLDSVLEKTMAMLGQDHTEQDRMQIDYEIKLIKESFR